MAAKRDLGEDIFSNKQKSCHFQVGIVFAAHMKHCAPFPKPIGLAFVDGCVMVAVCQVCQ